MSISSTTRKAGPYTGNGSTTVLPFSFKVFTSADVRVVRTDLAGVESDLALTTDYTVTLNADQDSNPGGTVNQVTAAASGFLTTITSEVDDLQPLVLTNAGGFYPSVINTALDRLTIMVQQVSEKVGRAVKVNISSSVSPDDLVASLQTSAADAAVAAGDAEAAAILAAASAASIPSMTGGADTVLVINPTNNGWLYKTATQMRTFLGLGSAALSNTGDFQAADADIPTVAASQAEMETGTEAALRSMSPLRVAQAIYALASNLMAEVATTSGTSVDITGIPSTAKRITLLIDSVSTNGTSPVLVQLGSGSVQTTGYESVGSYSGNAGQYLTSTSGFVIEPTTGPAATGKRHGQIVFTKRGSNRIVGAGIIANYIYGVASSVGGAVTLSGAIDRIRITTVGGSDTFDAGAIQVIYE